MAQAGLELTVLQSPECLMIIHPLSNSKMNPLGMLEVDSPLTCSGETHVTY
jgi:hypothetical protein